MIKVFRARSLLVDPVALRHASGFRLERNFRCARGCTTYPVTCSHRRGWHLFAFGLVVIVS